MTFTAPFRIGEWSVDPSLDEISHGTQVVKLPPRMMRLLCRLAEAHGQVVSTRQLLDSVWSGVVVGPASIYQAVSALRKTLGDDEEQPRYIATVARKGYRLLGSVEPAGSGDVARDPPAPLPVDRPRSRSRRGLALALAGLLLVALAITLVTLIAVRRPVERVGPAPAAPAPAVTEAPSIAIVLLDSDPDEPSVLFAQGLTDMVHGRLARQGSLRVVSVASAYHFRDPKMNVKDSGQRLGVQYLLRGRAARVGDQLAVEFSIVDTLTAEPRWSQKYVRAVPDVATLREDIVEQVGRQLDVKIGRSGNTPVDLAAYDLYMRGQLAISRHTLEGYSESRAIFRRLTSLYPDFARGYFGLAQALMLLANTTDPEVKGQRELLITSLNRALALDPEFGEAMIARGLYVEDPADAETMLRRGLALVPNYDLAAYHLGQFLANRGRMGEAIDAIDDGLRRDAASGILMSTRATILALGRGDIAGHDRTLNELLVLYPNYPGARANLGWSRYVCSGETAEGIRYLEREIARDPGSLLAIHGAAAAYLDVGDVAAASAVAGAMPLARLEIAQFNRRPHAIDAMPAHPEPWMIYLWGSTAFSSYGEALRDDAVATGNYAAALGVFDRLRSAYRGLPSAVRGLALAHADTLIRSGDRARGEALAKSLLQLVDAEQAGRPEHWYARDRAALFALLGDDERALTELSLSVQRKDLARWWYTAELDPVFARLRKDPRFQALAETARKHRAAQRALLEKMRARGEVPRRRQAQPPRTAPLIAVPARLPE